MSSSGALAIGTPYLPVKQITDRRVFMQAGALGSPATSGSLGNGSLRVSPGWIPNPITVSQLGAEITVIGDVGCTIMLTVYADAGLSQLPYPGVLVASGAIPADAIAVAEVDVADFTLPVGWCWIGGAVQGVTVTQPTVRTITIPGVIGLPIQGLPSAASNLMGFTIGGVTGAPPSPYTPAQPLNAGTIPKVHFRLA